MNDRRRSLSQPADKAVAAFLDQVGKLPAARPAPGAKGRLLFAIDATQSRQPTWDMACRLQADLFHATRSLGGLSLRLAYFRGDGEFAATPWLSDGAEIARRMTGVSCRAGQTQIERVLAFAARESEAQKVNALVYVGDAVEEPADPLTGAAGKLGLLGVPGFFFQEGGDPHAERVFRSLARLTGGAWAPFDLGAASRLKDLLAAVAVYAAGGRRALAELEARGGAAADLGRQLRLAGPGR